MKFQSIALAAITSSVPVFEALSSSKTSYLTRDNGNLNPFPIQDLENKHSSYINVMPAHRAVEANNLQWISTGEIPRENSLQHGHMLAMSDDGETIVVGYPSYDSNKGVTYVYSLENGQWKMKFNVYGVTNDDYCGTGLSISGDSSTIAIGIYVDNFGDNSSTGRIKIYRRSGSGWVHETDIVGKTNLEEFGYSVDLSEDGNTLIGGATRGKNGDSRPSGLSRVYRYHDANDNGSLEWTQLGNDILGDSDGDRAGYDVSLSKNGEIAAIGAIHNYYSGQTRVYEWTGSSWIRKGQDIGGETAWELSGWSVSLSDDGYTLTIGAPSYDDPDMLNRGVVRVYKWNESGSDWEKIAVTKGPHSESQSGHSVSLSGSGDVLAVGEPGYDGGHVRVLMNSGDTWTQLGQTIQRFPAKMGTAVALSNDGKTLACLERENGVYIYKLNGDLPGTTSQPSGFLSSAPSSVLSLSPSVAWDGTWFISYDSPADLSDKVLTTTYSTNPGISQDNVVVTLTDGLCNSGATSYDSSVITGFTVNIGSGTLVIPKTIDPAVIAADHNESYDFCETVTLKEDGWDMVYSQSQFTLTANFLEEIESYTATLEDNTVVIDEGDLSLDLEGTVTVTRCDGASNNLNPGDRLCLEISENDTSGVVVDRINDLNLQQGAVLFQAIIGGNIVLTNIVDESCENGSCTVYISLPAGLFADETDADTLTLDISGDVYLKEDNGKDSKAESTDAFNYSVQLQKPCEGGSLHGILSKLLS